MIRLPFDTSPSACAKMFAIDYGGIAKEAYKLRKAGDATAAGNDKKKVLLLGIDVQGTFCVPTGELFVQHAPEDTSCVNKFIEGNFNAITAIANTLDTHKGYQIFHPCFWVNAAGEHPAPFTVISAAEVKSGEWSVSPDVGMAMTGMPNAFMAIKQYAAHYVDALTAGGRYPLLIWPYHAMLGGINHALVSAYEATCFYHAQARGYNTHFETKGGQLPENYSVLQPEVLTGVGGTPFLQENVKFFEQIIKYDLTVIHGQAKSHCVAWTVSDLLRKVKVRDPGLLKKIALLEDCTSSVGGFEKAGDDAFAAFANDVKIIKHTTDVLSLV